jgi:hypothetical protein
MRSVLTMVIVAALVAAAGAGVVALRDHLDAEPVVLTIDAAVDPNPPTGLDPDAAAMERTPPLRLRFDAVGIDDVIRPVGLEEDGDLEIPAEDEIGWWDGGSSPGLPGATVMAAHVSWNDNAGPFNRLGRAEMGERLEIDTGEGMTRVYQVVERTMYSKDELPARRIWRTTGPETLVLITCGGSFNASIRRYRDNIVVYAVPVAQYPTLDADGDEGDESTVDTQRPAREEPVDGFHDPRRLDSD